MAKYFGLDIPEGLVDLFYKLLSIGNQATTIGYNFRPPAKAPVKRAVLRNRSLIVLWQSLYDGFDSTRRNSWDAYWATLPFGSHSGSNGWPGSGYSAFIYVNAPRYRLGQDLLLDPPFDTNLITNGMIVGNPPASWVEGDDGEFFGDGWLTMPGTSFPELAAQNTTQFVVSDTGNYRFTCQVEFFTDFPDTYDLGWIAVRITAYDSLGGEEIDWFEIGNINGNPVNNGLITFDFNFDPTPGAQAAMLEFYVREIFCGGRLTDVRIFAI